VSGRRSLTGSDQPILGATPAHMRPFGAYSGYFADPDGHLRGSAGTALGRPGACLAAPFADRNQRADVAGTDPGRRDKRHRPFRKRKRKIISAEPTVVFVIRHAARTRRRRRARRVGVSGPHPMRSAAVPGDETAGLVGVPARDGLDEAGVDLVAAAHLLRGEGVRGREDLEGPASGTFGSGQAASVAAAWRCDGPRGPGRSPPGCAPGAADRGAATRLPAGVSAAGHAARWAQRPHPPHPAQ
jgi:hypothetical protein